MRRLILSLVITAASCHPKSKNQLIGRWQLIRKMNDHKVIFEFDPLIHRKKYIYWFKDDSTLITEDNDGGNRQYNSYLLSNDKLTLFDSSRSNVFFYKISDDKLSMKSVYSPFNLQFRKLN
ncbi:MAG: hypothetical protein ACXVBZ_10560 [Flavisolibacter sp.]